MTTILIVDDSAVDRQLLAGLIEKDKRFDTLFAETGAQALNRLAEWGIDIVVTDLQMPGMDGLKLVKWIREEYPDIPTILATGLGSEEIAASALRAGAAGYVPKSQLADLLLPTIYDTIKILSEEQSYRNLIDQATSTAFHFKLDLRTSNIPPLVELCEQMVAGLSPLDRIEQLRIGVAVEQALHNALFRGTLEIDSSLPIPFGDEQPADEVRELIVERRSDPHYAERRISVLLEVTNSGLRCRIGDEGPGFKYEQDATDITTSGRGLVLMNAFMDELQFNETGNEVVLIRSWPAPEDREDQPTVESEEVEPESDEEPDGARSASERRLQETEFALKDLDARSDSDEFELRTEPPTTQDFITTNEEEKALDLPETTESIPVAVQSAQAQSDEKSSEPSVQVNEFGLGILISKETGERISITGRKQLVGRRKTCHITVPFQQVSSHHCQLVLTDGWWLVKDLNSSNGTKINGKRVTQGRLCPGDTLALGRHEFEIQYSPTDLGAVGLTPPPID